MRADIPGRGAEWDGAGRYAEIEDLLEGIHNERAFGTFVGRTRTRDHYRARALAEVSFRSLQLTADFSILNSGFMATSKS